MECKWNFQTAKYSKLSGCQFLDLSPYCLPALLPCIGWYNTHFHARV